MSKYTDWFDGDIKPVRKGVYQRYGFGDIVYSYWTGKYWGMKSGTVASANACRGKSANQNHKWRGLIEKA